jgi:predicted AlkP superfamily pyrophosphatase or phosphodiesterase
MGRSSSRTEQKRVSGNRPRPVRGLVDIRRALVLSVGLMLGTGFGDTALAAPKTGPGAQPKLVVLISVDQMRADYVDQFGKAWKKGLRRLYREGAVFTAARFPYLNTITCAGHSTIGTGAFPHRHGMVLNGWWSRERNKVVECTDDANSPVVSYGEASASTIGHSAFNLQVPSLADAMKSSLTPKPRVVAFSSKARSAIGLVGKAGDVVTWLEIRGWVTSKAYAVAPNPMVAAVVDRHPINGLVAKPWTKLGPERVYKFGDEDSTERPPMPFWTPKFPHVLQVPADAKAGTSQTPLLPLAAWERGPGPDAMLLEFAKSALSEMKLGQSEGTDVLALSFSQLDSVGHPFGPRSHEVQDILLRLDGLLGELLTTLDRKVGKNRYVLALTADHGVADYPERLAKEGVDAGRVSMGGISRAVNEAIATELGSPSRYVANVIYTELYLNAGVMDRLRAKPGAIARVAAAIQSRPGVMEVYSADQLKDPTTASSPLQRAAALSHFPARSGDFTFVPKRNWITTSTGTTHGTANDYDQHVPVIMYGTRFKRGNYNAESSPADIATTLAALLGVPLPTAEGRVLNEAISPPLPTLAGLGNSRP